MKYWITPSVLFTICFAALILMSCQLNEDSPTEPGCSVCIAGSVPLANAAVADPPAGIGGCPDGMAPLPGAPDVCVDRWEAYLVELVEGEEVPWSPYENPGDRTVMSKTAPGAIPQAYISQQEASGACSEAGKRLLTDMEWLVACQGLEDYTYPYGNDRITGNCNDERNVHPAIDFFGTDEAWIWTELFEPCLNQICDTLDLTGANSSCLSGSYFYDMMGNLNEWTSDPGGTYRGGDYSDTVINGNGCLYQTTAHNTMHYAFNTGFRCAVDLGP